MWKTKSKAENLIEDLEKKVYQKEAISLPKLKSYLFQQNEECWEEFEELLRGSRKEHSKERRIPLTLKELRNWKREWSSLEVCPTSNPNFEKKVGQGEKSEKRTPLRGSTFEMEQKETKERAEPKPPTLPTSQTHGPFIYNLRDNNSDIKINLFAEKAEVKWVETGLEITK